MQKLTNLKSNRGSALVGAVAICAILGISVAGLMGVTRNTVSQEIDSRDDARAFLAAESGLLMLADWVALDQGKTIATAAQNADGTNLPLTDAYGEIDLILRIMQPNGFDHDKWLIASTASLPGRLAYSKTLEWVVEMEPKIPNVPPVPLSPGSYGAVFNSSSGGDGMTKAIFHGRVHTNEHLYIYNNKNHWVNFFSDVSVHEPNGNEEMAGLNGNSVAIDRASYWANTGEGGRSERWDCSKGVSGHDGKVIGGGVDDMPRALSDIFHARYTYDNIFMKAAMEPHNKARRDTLSKNTNAGTLTFSMAADGITPRYTFTNGVDPDIVNEEIPTDREVIFWLDAPLTVMHGIVGGQVTVETAPRAGNNITLDLRNGSLTYYWANGTVNGFNESYRNNNDVLAFFSGNNINVSGSQSEDTRVLTAQLFANRTDANTIIASNTMKKLHFIGTLSVGKYWDLSGIGANDIFHDNYYIDPREIRAPGTIMVDKNGYPLDVNYKPIVEEEEEDNTQSGPFFLSKKDWLECNRVSLLEEPCPR